MESEGVRVRPFSRTRDLLDRRVQPSLDSSYVDYVRSRHNQFLEEGTWWVAQKPLKTGFLVVCVRRNCTDWYVRDVTLVTRRGFLDRKISKM